MLKKILTSGQSGVELAALNVAVKLDISYGGYASEQLDFLDKSFLETYNLKNLANHKDLHPIEMNILNSDGTLILSLGKLDEDTQNAIKLSEKYFLRWLHIDFNIITEFDAARQICSWIIKNNIETMTVTGSKDDENAIIHKKTVDILESAIYLEIIESDTNKNMINQVIRYPNTIDEAVDILINGLHLKDRVLIAHMEEDELYSLNYSLGDYIRREFGLWSGNTALMDSCRVKSDNALLDEEGASKFIIRELRIKLTETHKLRIIKG